MMAQRKNETIVENGLNSLNKTKSSKPNEMAFSIDAPIGTLSIDKIENDLEKDGMLKGREIIASAKRIGIKDGYEIFRVSIIDITNLPLRKRIGIKLSIELRNLENLALSYPDREVRWRIQKFLKAFKDWIGYVFE